VGDAVWCLPGARACGDGKRAWISRSQGLESQQGPCVTGVGRAHRGASQTCRKRGANRPAFSFSLFLFSQFRTRRMQQRKGRRPERQYWSERTRNAGGSAGGTRGQMQDNMSRKGREEIGCPHPLNSKISANIVCRKLRCHKDILWPGAMNSPRKMLRLAS